MRQQSGSTAPHYWGFAPPNPNAAAGLHQHIRPPAAASAPGERVLAAGAILGAAAHEASLALL